MLRLRVEAARAAWAANGFDRSIAFARDRHACDNLARVDLLCEVRDAFVTIAQQHARRHQLKGAFRRGNVSGDAESMKLVRWRWASNSTYEEHLNDRLEQGPLLTLCLAYAQVTRDL